MSERRRVVVVTGANSGIGKAATEALCKRGATAVMVCRSVERGERALEDIRGAVGDADAHVMQADLSQMASVRGFAERFLERFDRLDALINNAARFDISVKSPEMTAEGHEAVWATNHLGPFLLTALLRERIEASEGRVINVGSKGLVAYPFMKVDFANLDGSKRYSTSRAYYQSKLAQLMVTLELASRMEGSGATSTMVRVPAVRVPDERLPDISGFMLAIFKLKRRFALAPEAMAETYAWLALDAPRDVIHGKLIDERRRVVGVHRGARDPAIRERLWSVSEEAVGL